MVTERSEGKGLPRHAVWWLVATAALVQIITVIVVWQDNPNRLAAALLQAIAFATGIAASWIFGRGSVSAAADALVGSRARAPMRRSVSLHAALKRQSAIMGETYAQLETESREEVSGLRVIDLSAARWAIIGTQQVVNENIVAARDAIEEWRDMAPDEAEALAQRNSGKDAEEYE